MQTNYHQPVRTFKHQTMLTRMRDGGEGCSSGQRHVDCWLHDAGKAESPLLRRHSGKSNGHYTTRKLRSDYWNIINQANVATSSPTDLSVSHNMLLISNGSDRDNLRLFNIEQDEGKLRKLYELQSITVPGEPISSTTLLPSITYPASKYVEDHDQLLLTAHQDGVINLISTSTEEGNARIVRRYKHGKYLGLNMPETLDNWLQSTGSPALPIRKLKPWCGSGFASLLNDSFFIYEVDKPRAPQYLQSFPGLESFAINDFHNSYLIALTGSRFGNSRVALLDLRSGRNSGNLYIPDGNKTAAGSNLRTSSVALSASRECVWIDEFRVANCFNDVVKVWDIRSTDGENQCEIMPMRGCVEFLSYHPPTKTLYTGDNQGYIISWDLRHLSGIKKCIPSDGSNSFLMQQHLGRNTVHEINQCGSILVNGEKRKLAGSTGRVRALGKFLFMDTMSDGSLATLDSQELGIHQICHVKCSFQSVAEESLSDLSQEYTFGPLYPEEREKANSESDATFISSELSSVYSSVPSVDAQSSSYTLNSEPQHEPLDYNKQFMTSHRDQSSSAERSRNNSFLDG